MKNIWAYIVILFLSTIVITNLIIFSLAQGTKVGFYEDNPAVKGESFQEQIDLEAVAVKHAVSLDVNDGKVIVTGLNLSNLEGIARKPNDPKKDMRLVFNDNNVATLSDSGLWQIDVSGDVAGEKFRLRKLR